MSEVKFCKDCKSYSPMVYGEYPNIGVCKKIYVNAVDGANFPGFGSCHNARVSELYCGAEAKYFEPKEN